MKKGLNLTSIALFVITALGSSAVFAAADQTALSVDSNKVIELKDGSKVREMINNQQRSLYQIALLSSISIAELREMNAGRFDKKDTVEVGDRLVLPENSPLLPPITKTGSKLDDKYSNLPKLGSTNNYDPNAAANGSGSTQVASALQMAGQGWKQVTSSDSSVSSQLKDQGKTYADSYIRNGVKTQAVDPLRSAAQDFLGRFGTAQLQFDVGDKGDLSNINAKLFSPWYDSDATLIFSQMTFQEYEHNRRIGNFGIGQRWDVADKKWLLGYNVFFDHDFQRSHNRLGIGAEAWTDNMKFAANYYYPLSDWKNSRDFDDYLERAAKGFDIRFQGYLPQYPHLGGSLMYEQYFGDKVGLFGKDNLQKDPHAVTLGLDYTPVPLFTVKAEHKIGQDGKKDTRAELTLNYRIGTPLKDQMDPEMVQTARSLKGSRYDLVDRNNYIVLEYKEKKMSVDLGLERVQIKEGDTMPVSVGLHNARNISRISWTGDLSMADPALNFLCHNPSSGGVCPASSSWTNASITDTQNWTVIAPSYLSASGEKNPRSGSQIGTGKYTFAVTITDGRGKTASSNSVTFEVLPDYLSRTVKLDPVVDGVVQTSGVEVAAGREFTLKGSLMKNNVPFKDDSIVYPNTVTQEFINKLNNDATPIWLATDINGNRIKFGLNSCPIGVSECLYVTAVNKTTVSGGDVYSIDVKASARLQRVKFTLSLPPYNDTSTIVNISGGIPLYVDIFHVVKSGGNITKHELAATTGDSAVAHGTASTIHNATDPTLAGTVSTDNLVLGDTYYAVAKDVDGRKIDDRYIRYEWWLVSANGKTCEPDGTETKVDADPLDSTDISTYPTKYVPKHKAHPNLSGANKTQRAACAGDQGYKLEVKAIPQ
ncbi:inverse autotransporter beta domain-containing protein [Orbaceae bacterium ESL0727]|nr:inverse autotransporter beta domain-containing protein [Orbaceae bacterium ESL0727]